MSWIAKTTSDLLLCNMLDQYLLARGNKTIRECLRVCSTKHPMLAKTHDKLQWDNFVEGRICKTYLQLVADKE